MNKQEYENKKRKCWEEYTTISPQYKAFSFAFDRAYALGKQKDAISQEEIESEAVDYAFGENKKRPDARPDTAPEYACEDLIDAFKAGANFALGKQEKDAEETVISGWVARDEDGSLTLFYGSDKPSKKDNDDYWSAVFGNTLEYLPQEMFPDIKWEDVEPTQIELIIKRKKK